MPDVWQGLVYCTLNTAMCGGKVTGTFVFLPVLPSFLYRPHTYVQKTRQSYVVFMPPANGSFPVNPSRHFWDINFRHLNIIKITQLVGKYSIQCRRYSGLLSNFHKSSQSYITNCHKRTKSCHKPCAVHVQNLEVMNRRWPRIPNKALNYTLTTRIVAFTR